MVNMLGIKSQEVQENKSIKNITEEQRANRTSKLKTENINNGCKKIEDSIKTIKIEKVFSFISPFSIL